MANKKETNRFIEDTVKHSMKMGIRLDGEYLRDGKGGHAMILWKNLDTGQKAKRPFSSNSNQYAAKAQARQLRDHFNSSNH
jgi:hypothetical protein